MANIAEDMVACAEVGVQPAKFAAVLVAGWRITQIVILARIRNVDRVNDPFESVPVLGW